MAIRIDPKSDIGRALATHLGITTPKVTKYHNKKVEVDGITFDSIREANRFGELLILQKAGLIEGLTIHQKFGIIVNGQLVCTYEADFAYTDKRTGNGIVEDAKGVRTKEYRIKKKLMKAVYNIDVIEA